MVAYSTAVKEAIGKEGITANEYANADMYGKQEMQEKVFNYVKNVSLKGQIVGVQLSELKQDVKDAFNELMAAYNRDKFN